MQGQEATASQPSKQSNCACRVGPKERPPFIVGGCCHLQNLKMRRHGEEEALAEQEQHQHHCIDGGKVEKLQNWLAKGTLTRYQFTSRQCAQSTAITRQFGEQGYKVLTCTFASTLFLMAAFVGLLLCLAFDLYERI